MREFRKRRNVYVAHCRTSFDYFELQHVGSTGGVCPEFNIWGGVGWGGDDTVPCNCTHLGATQLMFLALAHISMLRN